jgi:hypothetical protein
LFRNDSEIDLPPELMDRLTAASREIAIQLRAKGETHESMQDSVVVLGLPPQSMHYSVVAKSELRKFLADIGASNVAGEPALPEVPRESLIARCLAPTPSGAVRVLFMARGHNGTLQIHLDAQDAGTGSRLRLHGRSPLLESIGGHLLADRPLLNGTYNLKKWLGDRTPEQGMADLKKEESSIVDRLAQIRAERAKLGDDRERISDVSKQLLKALDGYPPAQAKEILEQIHRENEDLIELRDTLARDEEERDRLDAELTKLLPGFNTKWEEVRQRARKAPVPPGGASATNVEVLLMAAAYVFDPVYSFATDLEPTRVNELISSLIGYYSHKTPEVRKLLEKMNGVLRGKPFSGQLQDFGHDWLAAGFPKLEVGHKLAATLALTDVPDDIEVLAPWKAWSLVIPPGLFGEPEGAVTYTRMWVRGTDIEFLVGGDGEIQGPLSEELFAALLGDKKVQAEPAAVAIIHAMRLLVKGACLALSNPDEYKRQSFKDKAANTKKPKRESDVPDFSVSRFMLSAPVQIDLRQHLLDYIKGKRRTGGGPLTVQHFVRGHWRNQAHGAGRSLRKQIRIEGFWKGPEEGRVLLRNYKVKEGVDAKVPEG